MRIRKLNVGLLILVLSFVLGACSTNVVTETIATPLPTDTATDDVTFEPDSSILQNDEEEIYTSVPKTSAPPDITEPDKTEKFCTLTVRCDDVLKNMDKLHRQKIDLIPSDGMILPREKLILSPGESVFDVLYRTLKDKGIHIEFVDTPMYNSVYVEGIGNLYEFDCGDTSGWTYTVNGESPMHGASQHMVEAGDEIEFVYKCSIFE